MTEKCLKLSMALIEYFNSIYRNTLQLNSEETTDKLKDADDLNDKLKVELESKTVQLMNSSNDLAHSHSELIKSRREIDVSFW